MKSGVIERVRGLILEFEEGRQSDRTVDERKKRREKRVQGRGRIS